MGNVVALRDPEDDRGEVRTLFQAWKSEPDSGKKEHLLQHLDSLVEHNRGEHHAFAKKMRREIDDHQKYLQCAKDRDAKKEKIAKRKEQQTKAKPYKQARKELISQQMPELVKEKKLTGNEARFAQHLLNWSYPDRVGVITDTESVSKKFHIDDRKGRRYKNKLVNAGVLFKTGLYITTRGGPCEVLEFTALKCSRTKEHWDKTKELIK